MLVLPRFARPPTWVLWALIPLSLIGVAKPAQSDLGRPPIGWSPGPSLPVEFVSRWDFSYAYFPPLDEVVLFGGAPKLQGEPWRNDTWIFKDGAWAQGPAAPPGLTPRGGAAMAFDPDIGKIVLFGGIGNAWPAYADTWLFDGTAWTQGPAAAASMGGRSGAQMTYLPSLGKLVLFAGSGIQPYNDTWFFDGNQWTAGPATPAAVKPRAFFGMAYHPALGRIFVAGGDGTTDTWYFDGTAWTPGPALDPGIGPRERVRIDYNPQLSSMVLFSGLGPGVPNDDVWLLKGGSWSRILTDPVNQGWPGPRVDGAVLWHPGRDALMVFAGIAPGDVGTTGLSDSWYFRDLPPRVASAAISPTAPLATQAINLDTGATIDGYGPDTREYEWYINGTKVPGVTGTRIEPGPYTNGDQVYARVRLTDELGLAGPWVYSNVVTINNRAPTIGSVTLTPVTAYVTSTLTATAKRVADPDGDPTTVHYTWTLNGADLPGIDQATLTPDHFTAGDVVSVRAWVIDARGAYSAVVVSPSRLIKWNLTPASTVKPGGSLKVSGGGFAPREVVQLKLDSATAATAATATASSTGTLTDVSVPVPNPYPGGSHTIFGIGLTSGVAGRGPFTVIPGISISPTALVAGVPTTMSGIGFVPGELVFASFPDGTSWKETADGAGSVTIAMVSPELPAPGGVVTGSGSSGSATAAYTVLARFSMPETGRPLDPSPVTLTGYGPAEAITAKFDGTASGQTFTTDPNGSLRADLTLPSTFGTHTIAMNGGTTAISKTAKVTLPATMTIAPTSGPVGTVVTIDSGPGWIPGSVVKLIWKAKTTVKLLTADAAGEIHTTWTIPQHSPGAVPLKLKSADLGLTASSTFTVTTAGQQATYGRRRMA
jgi:hypothetical protein